MTLVFHGLCRAQKRQEERVCSKVSASRAGFGLERGGWKRPGKPTASHEAKVGGVGRDELPQYNKQCSKHQAGSVDRRGHRLHLRLRLRRRTRAGAGKYQDGQGHSTARVPGTRAPVVCSNKYPPCSNGTLNPAIMTRQPLPLTPERYMVPATQCNQYASPTSLLSPPFKRFLSCLVSSEEAKRRGPAPQGSHSRQYTIISLSFTRVAPPSGT